MKIKDITNEARNEKDPDILGYEEIPVAKKRPHDIGSVKVEVGGKLSAYFTRLAKRFDRAKRIKEMLVEEEKNLKAETRAAVDDIFDAADEVYTRIVETKTLVFKIGKAEERTKEIFDEKGYLKELEKLTKLSVEELQKIQKKYIKFEKEKTEPKVMAPKVKKESIRESAFDSMKQIASSIKEHVMNFLSKWDRYFNRLKDEIESYL